MNYTINAWWLIALIFIPFLLGLIIGVKVAIQKIYIKMLKKLDMDQIKKLMDENK
jgi:hypothetical protein